MNATVLTSEEEDEAEPPRIAWGRPMPKDAWARAVVDCEAANDFREPGAGNREDMMTSCSEPLDPPSLTGKTGSSGGVGGKSFSTMNLSRPRTLPSSDTSTPNAEWRTTGGTGVGVAERFFHNGSEKK